MRKFAVACLFAGVALFGADQTTVNQDCVEGLENEIIGIIYSGKTRGVGKDEVTKKVSRTFEQRCSAAEAEGKQVIAVKKTADVKECVTQLEEEILRIINEAPEGIQELDLKILIDNVSQNFQECKPQQ